MWGVTRDRGRRAAPRVAAFLAPNQDTSRGPRWQVRAAARREGRRREDRAQALPASAACPPRTCKVAAGASARRLASRPTPEKPKQNVSEFVGDGCCATLEVEPDRVPEPEAGDAAPLLAGREGMQWGAEARQKQSERRKAAEEARLEKRRKPVERKRDQFDEWMKRWDDGELEEVELRSAESGAEGAEKVSKRPRVLDTTARELRRLHRQRHSPAKALMQFMLSMCTKEQVREWRSELEHLEDRVTEVVKSCRGCQLSEPKMQPGSSIPSEPVKSYLSRVWLDLVCLDFSRGWWALGIVDEGTDDCAFAFCGSKQVSVVYDAFFERWASLRGWTEGTVSDMAKELSSAKFHECLETHGTGGRHSAAGNAASHGRIERKFRTFRLALERETNGDHRPRNEREWKLFLGSFENAARNQMMKGGFSSSQRAWGRGTAFSSNRSNIASKRFSSAAATPRCSSSAGLSAPAASSTAPARAVCKCPGLSSSTVGISPSRHVPMHWPSCITCPRFPSSTRPNSRKAKSPSKRGRQPDTTASAIPPNFAPTCTSQ